MKNEKFTKTHPNTNTKTEKIGLTKAIQSKIEELSKGPKNKNF